MATRRFRIICSAGTYIRTPAEDVGRVVGFGPHLQQLRRTRAGRFSLTESVMMGKLENSVDPTDYLRDIRIAVEHLPEFVLSSDRIERTRNGMSTRLSDGQTFDEAPIRMVNEYGELIAIGFYDKTENAVQPKIVLV